MKPKKQKEYQPGQDWMLELARQHKLRTALYEDATARENGDVVVLMNLATSREFELFLIGVASKLAQNGDLLWSRVLWARTQEALPHLAENSAPDHARATKSGQ